MSILKSIITEKQIQPPPIGIVYGLPGIGKTTFGASLDNALIIDCENGANHVECHKTPYIKTWQGVKDVVNALIFEEHDYKTLVIDSLDWCFQRIMELISGDTIMMEAHGGWGKAYQHVTDLIFKNFIPMFNELNRRKNISIIFLAHAVQEPITDADGNEIEKICPDIPSGRKKNTFVPIFVEWVDFVYYMRFFKGERILQTQGNSKILAKSRIAIPEKIKVEEYKNYFIDTKTETEKE